MSSQRPSLRARGAPPVSMPVSAEFDDAVAQAVRLIRASRAPVIAGLAADVAGIVAAFRLAEKLGAAIDHSGAEWALRDQAVLQDIGMMLASPGEVRNRADTLLLVGDGPMQAWPELPAFLFADRLKSDATAARGRRIVALTSSALDAQGATVAAWLRAGASTLPGLLAALRAGVSGRPLARDFDRADEVGRVAEIMKAAAFGVALWCPDEIDALTIEMLTGLIKDLNAATRWSGLSVAHDTSATGAAMASGWMTGLPLRLSFARGRPAHDPWQYDARRLFESGEADAVVWISALGNPLPAWLNDVPTIVLAEPSLLAKSTAAVSILVGRPGKDHDGVIYDRATGTLVEVVARSPSDLPSAADALTRISTGLDAR